MLYTTQMPDSKVSLNKGMMGNLEENKMIFNIMMQQEDKEIIALAEEMKINVDKTSDGNLKDKAGTINFLIKGGCPNCGKKKV